VHLMMASCCDAALLRSICTILGGWTSSSAAGDGADCAADCEELDPVDGSMSGVEVTSSEASLERFAAMRAVRDSHSLVLLAVGLRHSFLLGGGFMHVLRVLQIVLIRRDRF